jgi:AraC-like DNA-binding protein
MTDTPELMPPESAPTRPEVNTKGKALDKIPPHKAFVKLNWSEPELRGEWASTPSFKTKVQRLAGGAFNSDATLVQMPLMRISVERLSGAPVRVIGQIADDCANACIAVGPKAILNGVQLQTPSLHLHGAGARFDSITGGDWFCGLLRFSHAVLTDPEDPLHAWFDSRQRMHRVLRASGHRLTNLILMLSLRAERNPDGLTGMPEALLLDDVISALRDAIDAAQESPSALDFLGSSTRRRLALAAEELIRIGVSDGSQLSIEALCKELHVSQRLLQLAFLEQFGVNARNFVLSARIQRAHTMLLANGDQMRVSDLATQAGIWNLGRFSMYYRQFFGCTPSEMQRRIWGKPVIEPQA